MGIDDEIARGELGPRTLDLAAVRKRVTPTGEGVYIPQKDFEAILLEIERLRASYRRMTAILGVP
jgi:hypothetical protein